MGLSVSNQMLRSLNEVRRIFFESWLDQEKFSFAAKLVIYINRIITPPKKIINRIKENHGLWRIIEVLIHRKRVWPKIIEAREIGWVEMAAAAVKASVEIINRETTQPKVYKY
jgi:hypothetical protein